MAVILANSTTPSTRAAGAFPLSTFQSGPAYAIPITMTSASTSASYNGDKAVLTTSDNGGLYFSGSSGRQLSLYNGSGAGTLVAQLPAATWSAGQLMWAIVKIAAGTNASSLSLIGATTGGGTVAFTTSGTYFTNSTLGVGKWGGGSGFDLAAAIGDITDNTASMTPLPSTAAASVPASTLAPGGASMVLDVAAAIARAMDAVLDGGGNLIPAPAVAAAAVPTASMAPGATLLSPSPATAAASAPTPTLTTPTLALSVHGIDFQIFGNANRNASITLNFEAGSMILVTCGGKHSDVAAGITSSRGETFRLLDAVHDYPDFPGYGTAVYVCYSAVGGVTTITHPVTLFDEDTTMVCAIKRGKIVRSLAWTNLANAGAGTTQVSGTVVATAPAVLLMLWYGSGPVFSPNTTPFTAVPSRGAVIESYLVNNSSGEVQAALAVEEGVAAGAYSVTWTHSPPQGAQLWMLAIQDEEILPVASASASVPASSLVGPANLTPAPATAAASVPAASLASSSTITATPAGAAGAVPAQALAAGAVAVSTAPATAAAAALDPSLVSGADLSAAPALAAATAPSSALAAGGVAVAPAPAAAAASSPAASLAAGGAQLAATPAVATAAVPAHVVASGGVLSAGPALATATALGAAISTTAPVSSIPWHRARATLVEQVTRGSLVEVITRATLEDV